MALLVLGASRASKNRDPEATVRLRLSHPLVRLRLSHPLVRLRLSHPLVRLRRNTVSSRLETKIAPAPLARCNSR